MVAAWRLAAPEHARSARQLLSGDGARLYGGRWNSPGGAVVYLADSLALATLELLVHIRSLDVLAAYRKMRVHVPERPVEHIRAEELPGNWIAPEALATTRTIGDEWLRQASSVALQVPSAVVPGETNFLLNPAHEEFDAIEADEVTAYRVDPRLAADSYG